jgi:hypothetical protein
MSSTHFRLDVDSTRLFASNVGHDVANLAPVIRKASSIVRGMGGILGPPCHSPPQGLRLLA